MEAFEPFFEFWPWSNEASIKIPLLYRTHLFSSTPIETALISKRVVLMNMQSMNSNSYQFAFCIL